MNSHIFRPASDVVARRLGDSAVLIRLTTNRIYELNLTGARVWDLVNDGASVDSVLDTLGAEFDVAPEMLHAEVDALLNELVAEGLLVARAEKG